MVYSSSINSTTTDHNRFQVHLHVTDKKRHHVRIRVSRTSRSRIPTRVCKVHRATILVVQPGIPTNSIKRSNSLFPTAMISSWVGIDFYCIGKNRQETTTATFGQWYSCSSSSSYFVAALATVQQGKTAASHMEWYVVGAQPYDNKQLCSKSARMM